MLERFDPLPARSVALWELVATSLRRAIVLGELPDGLRLEESALTRKFKVSRIPIREAISRLEHEGLVRVEPPRGAFVVRVTEDDIHDHYEIRRFVETCAIRRTVRRIDPKGQARLQLLVDQMDAAARQGQRSFVTQADVEFHRQIVVLAQSPPLLATWDPIGGFVETILSIASPRDSEIRQTLTSHQAMVDALAERDVDRAERLLQVHLESGERVMCDALRVIVDTNTPSQVSAD